MATMTFHFDRSVAAKASTSFGYVEQVVAKDRHELARWLADNKHLAATTEEVRRGGRRLAWSEGHAAKMAAAPCGPSRPAVIIGTGLLAAPELMAAMLWDAALEAP